jgi:predicted O-methyltransferase YrrM
MVDVALVVERILCDRPAFHGDGRLRWDVSPGTLHLLARLAGSAERSLEVGCGVSTVVFAAAGIPHLTVSPVRQEYERIEQYCAAAGVSTASVVFREGFSDRVLPTVDRDVDLALIDGAHSFPHPVVDFHYVSRLLRPGGVLLLDDIPIPSVGGVYRFLRDDERWEQVDLVDHRAAAFRLVGVLPDGDPWGDQRGNATYPDYSFLPLAQRSRVELREWLSHNATLGRARRRHRRLDRLAPTLRRILG